MAIGAGELALGTIPIVGGVVSSFMGNRAQNKAQAEQRRQFELLNSPQYLALRNQLFGDILPEQTLNTFGGTKRTDVDVTPEQLQEFLAANPELQARSQQQLEEQNNLIREKQQQLLQLRQGGVGGPQEGILQQEINQLQQQQQQFGGGLEQAFAESQGLVFDPQTGGFQQEEQIEGIQQDLSPFRDEGIADLSGQLSQAIGAQQDPTQQAIEQRLSGVSGALGTEAGTLQNLLGESQMGLAGAGQLGANQTALAQQGMGQAQGAFDPAAQAATQFGGQFQPGFDSTFQDALQESLGQAQNLSGLAQQNADDLINANAEQFASQKQDAIDQIRDTMAAQGLGGSGAEREAIAGAVKDIDRAQRQDASRLRQQAQQQSFQNQMNAQQNVGQLAGQGSGLRGQRLGQDISAGQAGVGFLQQGANLGLEGIRSGLGFGQQGLQGQQALGSALGQAGGFQAGLAGRIGDIGTGLAQEQFNTQIQQAGLPADILARQIGVRGQEEARQGGLSKEEFDRQSAVINQRQNLLTQSLGQGSADTRTALAGQSAALTNQANLGAAQAAGGAASIGAGVRSLGNSIIRGQEQGRKPGNFEGPAPVGPFWETDPSQFSGTFN